MSEIRGCKINILKFDSERQAKEYWEEEVPSTFREQMFSEWLLDNCAALWHTGEIWLFV